MVSVILLFLFMLQHKPSSIARFIIWTAVILLIIPSAYFLYFNKVVIIEWTILTDRLTQIVVPVILDPKGLIFSTIVFIISANVLRFSTIYIKEDIFIDRFTILVFLFVLSINFLIYLPHFIVLLLGWDGLGITSFILVVYYQNPKSLGAGIITAITNRIGDVILLLSIAISINQGHWNILNIWDSVNKIAVIIVIIAAITKSAQIPFSRWLPAAIAAPTPVSALVHSSTLVTAGVFLVIRFYPFLHSLKWFNIILLFISVSTILIAGLRATTECDIKKIIALSTLSQLGIIIARLGLNFPNLAYFHIATHALFKALLFICAGTLIRYHSHRQDLRWIGNLSTQAPIASSCILTANIALCGFPYIAGFYSKDLILEASIFSSSNIIILALIFFAVGLTSFYSLRFIYVVIWGPRNRVSLKQIYELNSTTKPILILSIFSTIMGATMIWCFPPNSEIYLRRLEKFIPLLFTLLGIIRGIFISDYKKLILVPQLQFISCLIWFLTPISSQFIILAPIKTANYSLALIDQSWLEYIGRQGINSIINKSRNLIMGSTISSPSRYLLISTITIRIYLYLISS